LVAGSSGPEQERVRASGREIRHLYLAELRGAFRERNVVINTVLVPVLLYPLILWLLINGLMFVQGQTERLVSRVEVAPLPPEHTELLDRIAENEKIEIETAAASAPDAGAALESRIASGDLDAALELEEKRETSGDFRAVVTENSARESSATAGSRLLQTVRAYRDHWLRDRAASLVGAAEWEGYRLERANLASSAQMGAMILGLIAPLYFVIMVAVGTLYPAVDTTAGEHERGTWETTLSMAASRSSIVVAKYLYVTTMGFVAGLLNLAAMTLSMGSVLAPLLAEGDAEIGFDVPWRAMPWVVLGALFLAGSVAAAMMTVAVFARTFREGQAMTTPLMLLATLPVVFLGREGLELTPSMAAIPVVNVAMLAREALLGTLRTGPALITLAVQLGLIAILLAVASRVIRNEDILTGSFTGGPMAYLRQKFGRGTPPANEVTP
jgi:ABC-type Na+ efflux pump permease subunit